MAIVHDDVIRTIVADAVVDSIDGGTGPGTLELLTAADAVVATLTFSEPAFGAAVAGVATANAITEDDDAVGGIIAKFVVKNGDGDEIFSGTVGHTAGDPEDEGDLNFSSAASLTVGAGDTVSLASAPTYTAPL